MVLGSGVRTDDVLFSAASAVTTVNGSVHGELRPQRATLCPQPPEVEQMRIPWYAKAGVVAGTGFAAVLLVAPSAFAAVALTRLSTDTFTNSTSAHATQVEPDTYAFGSTIVMAAQTGRFNDGGASDIAYATSTDNGVTWSGGNLPGITTFAGGGPYNRVSDAAVAFDARHGVWLISTLPLLEAGGVHGAAILTSRSTNGGASFGNPVPLATRGGLHKKRDAPRNNPATPLLRPPPTPRGHHRKRKTN